MTAHGPMARPCGSCPYRRDVPSGVWAASEYDRLPDYDLGTPFQPPRAFFCHQQNGHLCAGWVGCHDMQESLGLRIVAGSEILDGESYQAALDYVSPVELFASGAEAAAHGKAEIITPSLRARRVVDKVRKRQARVLRSTAQTSNKEVQDGNTE